MKQGIAYGVGVGPGDPELMTLKSVRLIKENNVIAVPGRTAAESAAYKIALTNVPDLAEKEVISIYMPMVKDRQAMKEAHKEGAGILEEYLARGENVVFLTLGDPSIYSTFTYLQRILEEDGFEVKLVSAVTSFCAAAAALNTPLAQWEEPLHIIPAAHRLQEAFTEEYGCRDTYCEPGKNALMAGSCALEGNYVLMKPAGHMSEVKDLLRRKKLKAYAVENCGMENEKIYRCLDEIPDEAGYFSLVIAKT